MSSPSRNVNQLPPTSRKLDYTAAAANKSSTPATKPQRPKIRSVEKERRTGPFDLSALSDDEEQPDAASIDPSLINMPDLNELLTEGDGRSGPTEDPPPEDPDNTMQSIEPDGLLDTTMQSIEDVADAPLELEQPTTLEQSPPKDKPAPARRRKGGRKVRAPQERKTNTQSRVQKPTEKVSSRAGSAAPRPTYTVARSETPATDGGSFRTRSGRACIKPLASWRGEKAIYGQRTSRDSPPALQEVVRTDEVTVPPRQRPASLKPAARRKARSRTVDVIPEEDEEDAPVFEQAMEEDMLEPWELNGGIQHAITMQWDEQAERYDETKTEELGGFLNACSRFRIHADCRNRLCGQRN